MVSEFLSDRRQLMTFDGKVTASVDVVLGVPQDSVLGPLSFIVHTSELVLAVGNHIVFYADNTTFYAVIPKPLLHLDGVM